MSTTLTGGYNLGQLVQDLCDRAWPVLVKSGAALGNGSEKRGEMFRLALRAALFDRTVFSEIGDAPEDMFRALGVVLVAAIAFGLGIRSVMDVDAAANNAIDTNLRMFVAMSTIVTSWAIWSAMVWLLGTKLFRGKSSYRGILRTLGICYGPVVFWLFLNLSVGGQLLAMWAHIWILGVGVLAVHKAQDIAWWKASISASLGWLWGLVIVPYLLVAPLLAPVA